MPDKKFSHLPLPLIAVGQPKITGMGSKDKRTEYNKTNRVTHGSTIKRTIGDISKFWTERQEKRIKERQVHKHWLVISPHDIHLMFHRP